ncbi:MAG: hypothetical protein K2X99_06595, partial [Gemmatimonadaceae bacterium]|nr:hypothetical protein [Gemmatimonadaceae bacterium]
KQLPRGNFHWDIWGGHEYRSATPFPAAGGRSAALPGYNVFSMLMEIRIGSGVLTYQMRNPIGTVYNTVPGFLMPRNLQLYGLRWEFWN